jgi:hypothetical protein
LLNRFIIKIPLLDQIQFIMSHYYNRRNRKQRTWVLVNKNYFDKLPLELLWQILSSLNLETIRVFSFVSKGILTGILKFLRTPSNLPLIRTKLSFFHDPSRTCSTCGKTGYGIFKNDLGEFSHAFGCDDYYCYDRNCPRFAKNFTITKIRAIHECDECHSALRAYSCPYFKAVDTDLKICNEKYEYSRHVDSKNRCCFDQDDNNWGRPKKFSCDMCLREIFSYAIYDNPEDYGRMVPGDKLEDKCQYLIECHREGIARLLEWYNR